jgi:hypothetical protein
VIARPPMNEPLQKLIKAHYQLLFQLDCIRRSSYAANSFVRPISIPGNDYWSRTVPQGTPCRRLQLSWGVSGAAASYFDGTTSAALAGFWRAIATTDEVAVHVCAHQLGTFSTASECANSWRLGECHERAAIRR